jgi:hypothetical protein
MEEEGEGNGPTPVLQFSSIQGKEWLILPPTWFPYLRWDLQLLLQMAYGRQSKWASSSLSPVTPQCPSEEKLFTRGQALLVASIPNGPLPFLVMPQAEGAGNLEDSAILACRWRVMGTS